MKTALLTIIMLSLYPFARDGFTRLGKDILLGVAYLIAGIIRLTRKIINSFKRKIRFASRPLPRMARGITMLKMRLTGLALLVSIQLTLWFSFSRV